MLTISNIIKSRLVIGCFILPRRSSICGRPLPASLVLEDVVDLLERLFALSFAQDSSSGEKYGSIFLECDRNAVDRPSALSHRHEIGYFDEQGFEVFWLLVLLDRRKNLCLQFLPAWQLFHAGSRLGGRCTWWLSHVRNRLGGRLFWLLIRDNRRLGGRRA